MNLKILRQPYPFDNNSKKSFQTAIAFGSFIFFFLWAFQPFGISQYSTTNKTLMLAGYGLITFATLFLNSYVFKRLFPIWFSEKNWTVQKNILYTLWIVFLIGIGNLFYTHNIGILHLTFDNFITFQGLTILVGSLPIIISNLLVHNTLFAKNKKYSNDFNQNIGLLDTSKKSKQLPIPSKNKSENYLIDTADFLYAKSFENYVLIQLIEEKITIRNTITQIELALKTEQNISRCHRGFLVNLLKVEKVSGNAQGLQLQLKGVDSITIPVSRTYVKELQSQLNG